MKAIRGATTIQSDTPQQIKCAVKELLSEIRSSNKLDESDIVCILFSSTSDIRSFYPAKAAREAGFSRCALYSSAEPEIDGALGLCIRVMVLAECGGAPCHVYLNGAKALRKDISEIINVALDGPAGSGKSTVSKLIAKKLDILYLDTGAMYRAVALQCLRKGVDYAEKEQVGHLVDKIDLKVEYDHGRQRTLLDGEDVSELIRTPQISMLASYVSSYSFVRTRMVALQREIALGMSCILDGRDIGTNVLPDCKFKFYLTASPEVRARRRYEEDRAKGGNQSYDEVLKEIEERDRQDKNRAVAPLKMASDAVLIDSSGLTVEEVVELILNRIQEKI